MCNEEITVALLEKAIYASPAKTKKKSSGLLKIFNSSNQVEIEESIAEEHQNNGRNSTSLQARGANNDNGGVEGVVVRE